MHSPVHAAAALYVRGHVGVIVVSQSGLAMIVHCVLSTLPYSVSGAAAESAQYDRVKHDMCHQHASGSARLAPNDATHDKAPRSNAVAEARATTATTPPTMLPTERRRGSMEYSLAVPSASRWSRRVRSLFRRSLGL
jgi:hypothetical protein